MSDISTSKMITLKSNDGKEFVVHETVAKQSITVCDVIENTSPMNPIPIPNVTARILEKVIEYCTKHVEAAHESETETTEEGSSITQASTRISDEDLRNWDRQFVNVDWETLFDLTKAANYLDIKGLLDATCKMVADRMLGMSVEEIRKIFNIKNDYTAEEEEKFREDHHWAFA